MDFREKTGSADSGQNRTSYQHLREIVWNHAGEAREAENLAAIWPEISRAVVAASAGSLEVFAQTIAAVDRIGYAFVAGYNLALRMLLAGVPHDGFLDRWKSSPWCLSVTEENGAHPRTLQSMLVPEEGLLRLRGRKMWATGVNDPIETLAITIVKDLRAGSVGEKQPLVAVAIPLQETGVEVLPMPPTPFVPEIPHVSLVFDNVVDPAWILQGDGWTDYAKPFRTWEDACVMLAVSLYLAGYTRRAGSHEATSAWINLASQTQGLLAAARQVGWTAERLYELHGLQHLLGVMASACRQNLERDENTGADAVGALSGERPRIIRDLALLQIAGKARAQRLLKVLESLEGR